MSAENQKAAAETGDYPSWWLMLSIVNVGRSSAWIDDIAIEIKLDEKSIREWKSRLSKLPWQLEPGEIKSWTVRSDDAGALRKGQELRVMAKTGIGTKFYSQVIRVGKDGANMVPPEQAQAWLDALPDSKRPDTRELELHGYKELFRELGIDEERQRNS